MDFDFGMMTVSNFAMEDAFDLDDFGTAVTVVCH